MFSIGEFSNLCHVTTKTLRHYDNIGLLKPAYLNEENGYRYYEAAQLRRMVFIIRLREYGFSLDEIAELIGADDDAVLEGLKGKLKQQVKELGEKSKLIEQMKTDIERMEKGKNIMSNKIEVKIAERQPVDIVSVWETVSMKDGGMDKLFGRLMAKVEKLGAEMTGAPIAIYHCYDFDPESTEVELAFPTNTANAVTRTMDGGKFATATHKGPYSKLNETYTAIGEWMDKNGYAMKSSPYEIYLNSPGDVQDDELLTEIYFPVK